MVQSVSASVTDTKFRLGELGVGSNPCPVGHHRDYHVSLTLDSITVIVYSYSSRGCKFSGNVNTFSTLDKYSTYQHKEGHTSG